MTTNDPTRTMTINGEEYVRTRDIVTVMPPIMHTMLAAPHELNMEAYLQGYWGTYHDEMRFNVLYPSGTPKLHQPDGMAYLILRGPGEHDCNTTRQNRDYFTDNVIYDNKDSTVTLYDVIHHRIVDMGVLELLGTAFEHRTMTLDEVCTTFFVADDPVYGQHFDKDNIHDALTWAAYQGGDPYPAERIAAFVGVKITQQHYFELVDEGYDL